MQPLDASGVSVSDLQQYAHNTREKYERIFNAQIQACLLSTIEQAKRYIDSQHGLCRTADISLQQEFGPDVESVNKCLIWEAVQRELRHRGFLVESGTIYYGPGKACHFTLQW